MRIHASIALALILAVLTFSPLQAAQEKSGTESGDDIKAVHPILPDPEKVLDQLVGNWTYSAKWWETPESEPLSWDGKFMAGWVLDKSVVEFKARTDTSDREYEGIGFMGYDKVTGEYSHVWMDTTGTGMWFSRGGYDPDKNAITDTGKYSNPATGIRDSYKGVTTFTGSDEMSYEFYTKGPDGALFRQMEILYKRVK